MSCIVRIALAVQKVMKMKTHTLEKLREASKKEQVST